MKFVLATFVVSFFLIAPVAFGQQMGAGKLTDTEAEFQKLAAQCDEVEVLMLRARIRLEVSALESRAETEEAAKMQMLMPTVNLTFIIIYGDVVYSI